MYVSCLKNHFCNPSKHVRLYMFGSVNVQFKRRMTLWEFLLFKCSTVCWEEEKKSSCHWQQVFLCEEEKPCCATEKAEWTSDAAGYTLGHVRTALIPKSSKKECVYKLPCLPFCFCFFSGELVALHNLCVSFYISTCTRKPI